jgi:hypothetical protein
MGSAAQQLKNSQEASVSRGWAFSVRPNDGVTVAEQLRIGDAERQSAASALGDHVSAGRLSWDEYDARVQNVYAAKTRADLAPLFRDLPPLPPGPQPKPSLGTRFVDASGVPVRLVALFLLLFVALRLGSLFDLHAQFLIPAVVFLWFGSMRHRHHHRNHPRGRQVVPASASPWEPPRRH